jgi:large subunit ribosomal protein L19
MAIKTKHQDTEFGVGDRIKVIQKIKEGSKEHSQTFEGMVVGIKGRGPNQSFTVRRIGVQQIGIERIFPLALPNIEVVEVVRKGTRGVRRAKLYYTRGKSKKEIDRIYSRAAKKEKAKSQKVGKRVKKAKPKKTSKKEENAPARKK